MRKYRICENDLGKFKIQFKLLGIIWYNWRPHFGADIMLFPSYKMAETEIKTLKIKKERNYIRKVKSKSWKCLGEM
jgi:hypothetical protein